MLIVHKCLGWNRTGNWHDKKCTWYDLSMMPSQYYALQKLKKVLYIKNEHHKQIRDCTLSRSLRFKRRDSRFRIDWGIMYTEVWWILLFGFRSSSSVLIVPKDPTVRIHYSIVASYYEGTGDEQKHNRYRVPNGSIVDPTIRTLGTTAHFADIQQICLQGVENGFVEAFWNWLWKMNLLS